MNKKIVVASIVLINVCCLMQGFIGNGALTAMIRDAQQKEARRVEEIARQQAKKSLLALATGIHPRCGTNSSVNILSAHLIQQVGEHLPH